MLVEHKTFQMRKMEKDEIIAISGMEIAHAYIYYKAPTDYSGWVYMYFTRKVILYTYVKVQCIWNVPYSLFLTPLTSTAS